MRPNRASATGARCLAVLTRSGATARIIAAGRPAAPLLALAVSPAVQRRLVLLWGVCPAAMPARGGFSRQLAAAGKLARRLGLGRRGQLLIVVSGLSARSTAPDSIVISKIP